MIEGILLIALLARWGYLEWRMYWLRRAKATIKEIALTAGSSTRAPSAAEHRELFEEIAGLL